MRRTTILALAAALALSACGASGTAGAGGEEATLALDGPPNAAHVGIFTALSREYDDAEGLELRVRRRGDADLEVLGLDELARRRDAGEDLVGVMAILQRTRRDTWPGLVLAADRTTLRDDRDVVDAAIAALRRGYEEALRDPELAAETVARRNRGVDRRQVLRELRALGAAFTTGAPRFGVLDRSRLEAWARATDRRGVVDEAFDLEIARR